MNGSIVTEDDFNRLRTILLKPQAQRLDLIEQRLDRIEQYLKALPKAEEVSTVLPEAVRISGRKSDELATSLGPLMASGLDQSLARNKDRMINTLYPLMGAMIRRNIAESMRAAIKSLNLILERALSLEGIRWRWESFRTGTPVSRIAFRHSIVFRVEQIFLIHNRTSQTLFHLSIPEAIETDKVVFSGMVGAITDFIKDAFFRNQPIGLQSIDVGEFTVWFEEGPEATIAIVIRGEPQALLRYQLDKISEKLHAQYPVELKNAMVDEISTTSYDSLMRGLLLQQARKPLQKRKYVGRAAAVALALVLLILTAMGAQTILRTHSRDARFNRFISRVRNSQGVLITDYGKGQNGKYFVSGVVTGSTSSAVLPIEDFDFKADEIDVKLINHVFAVDKSNSNQQVQNFLDQLHQLDGIPCPIEGPVAGAWIEETANRLADAYTLGRALGRPFIVIIEYPDQLQASADRLAGQIGWRLYLHGVYEPYLVRTRPVKQAPAHLRVLQERTVGQ